MLCQNFIGRCSWSLCAADALCVGVIGGGLLTDPVWADDAAASGATDVGGILVADGLLSGVANAGGGPCIRTAHHLRGVLAPYRE